MKKTIKCIWLISSIAVLLSLVWYLLCATACFQRRIDLITTVILMMVWMPALGFVIASFLGVKRGWIPRSAFLKVLLLVAVVALSVFFTSFFIRNSNVNGWLIEYVEEDYSQTTSDGKYEYRLELVNLFQRNSYARLYAKNLATGEEITIPLNIKTPNIIVIMKGKGSVYPEPETPSVWSVLTPTDTEFVYVLTTTEMLDRDEIFVFEIDFKSKTAKIQ